MLTFAVLSLESSCDERAKVVAVVFGVVTANFQNFGDESLSWAALQLNEDVQRIGDITRNRATWKFDSALKNAACKSGKGLASRACVDR